ncbi:hypothetical protein D3C73_1373530 [compost metagenome]
MTAPPVYCNPALTMVGPNRFGNMGEAVLSKQLPQTAMQLTVNLWAFIDQCCINLNQAGTRTNFVVCIFSRKNTARSDNWQAASGLAIDT